MSQTYSETLQQAEGAAEQIRQLLAPVHAALTGLGAEIAARSKEVDAQDRSLVEGDLEDLPGFFSAHALLKDIAVGVGFAGSPGAVDNQERYLLWWQRRNESLARLRLNLEPASIDVYDYLEMDWFKTTAESRLPVIYGPYVDYSGSGLYIFTVAVPVRTDQFIGIAGADLSAREVERRLTARLRAVDLDALVATGERRVLAANTARWVVGSKLAKGLDGPSADFRTVVPVGLDTDWFVAAADPE